MNTLNESNVQAKQTFQPALPLACTVSDEMKAKLWANQFEVRVELLVTAVDTFFP